MRYLGWDHGLSVSWGRAPAPEGYTVRVVSLAWRRWFASFSFGCANG